MTEMLAIIFKQLIILQASNETITTVLANQEARQADALAE